MAAKFNDICPAKHPSFDTGKCYGCTKYLDVTDDARSRVPRDSKEFEETFKDRQIVEQYFSRLGARSGEPFAVQRLLGHADLQMATRYVQDVSKQTDRVIENSRMYVCQINK